MLPVKTREFQESIAKICRERCDDWSLVVLGRLEYAQDLNAMQAVYHQSCSVNFRTGKQLPKQYVDLGSYGAKRIKQQGRPVDNVKFSAFMKVVNYLEENEEEQVTIADLTTD